MSAASPQYRLPTDLDDDTPLSYDPQFTADISNKMQVPDRIQMHGQSQSGYPSFQDNEDPHREVRHAMKVPDRIVIAGHDQHIGMKQEPRPLELDVMTQADHPSHYVGLTTPPRVLTVEETVFPIVEEDEEGEERERRREVGNGDSEHKSHNTALMLDLSAQAGQGQLTLDDLQVAPYSPGGINDSLVELDEEDERAILRRHVTKLTRRIMQLENSDQRRFERELFYCSLASVYFLWKIWSWIGNGR